MSAAIDIVRRMTRAGIQLEARGDRLHVEAPKGAVTEDVRALLVNRKADLLAELSGPRATLLRMAKAERVDAALIHALPAADVADCANLSTSAVRAYVLALHEAAQRELGNRPLNETERALCRKCGPVWTAPNVAALAPVVDGWPLLLGCPWCHVMDRKRIPRPLVSCGDCRHFERDTVNAFEGCGTCRAGKDPPRPWPSVKRICEQYRDSGPAIAGVTL